MNRSSQRGVALVITLIMLSVVTFMAVAFLALSRRERGAVNVSTDQATATAMAEAALARAQSQIISSIQAHSNLFSYDFMVSTNFINPDGYNPNQTPNGVSIPKNVNYDFIQGRPNQPLNDNQRIQVIRNLMIDPRPPVYIATNRVERIANQRPYPLDFRFYWDVNQNGRFETNGYIPVLGNNGQRTGISSLFTGDPEWIGVLENPNYPHSRTNRFIGRFAYLVLPAGKSLDLNFIHNHSKYRTAATLDGYLRNQGVGSWELNLAAFFRELNTNEWPQNSYYYDRTPNIDSKGQAFRDALTIVNARGPLNNDLLQQIGPAGVHALQTDFIDDYSVGPLMNNVYALNSDLDKNPYNLNKPWPGSDSPRIFADVQEMFTPSVAPNSLSQKLRGVVNTPTTNSSYDRYTFYRLLAQMGVDSVPASTNKININYANDPNASSTLAEANSFVEWTPLGFFTNAADRLLRTQLGLSLTNIPIYPTNYYTPAVHRLLQLAANIYDATTNNYDRTRGTYPYLPSVFRPVFRSVNNNVFISGYVEVGSNATAYILSNPNPWVNVQLQADRNRLRTDTVRSNVNVYGIPMVIGAKRGLPTFNEFSFRTIAQLTRKMELIKPTLLARPTATNEMYILGVSNIFGVEAWNSYMEAYPRRVQLLVTNVYSLVLSNNTRRIWPVAFPGYRPAILANVSSNVWPGNIAIANSSFSSNSFIVFTNQFTNGVFLTNSIYFGTATPPFRPNTPPIFYRTSDFLNPTNHIRLIATNRLQFILLDRVSNRILDFVNLDNLVTSLDITAALIGNNSYTNDSIDRMLWDPIMGMTNQMQISLGNQPITESMWASYSQDVTSGQERDKAIDRLRVFCNLTPLKYSRAQLQQELGNTLWIQTPFNPTRKFVQTTTLQANDPLVHYTIDDLVDLYQTNDVQVIKPVNNPVPQDNLGLVNRRYRPWGGNPNISSDTNAYNVAFKDPMVRRSDDWNFPTNKFPNIGWLGRVHRGTPWQTIYLKSTMPDPRTWWLMSGNPLTNPTNDWRLLQEFTVSPNANASRGLLAVNQTNLASWSAVLSGVSVLSNSAPRLNAPSNVTEVIIEPGSPQLRRIVDGISRTKATRFGQSFQSMGEVLATPELTVQSPYLNHNLPPQSDGITDEVMERIPQQILSLIKADEPRVVVYVAGQALAPVGPPVLAPGQPYHQMYTNYVPVSEVLTKYAFRIEGTATNPVVVPERFQYMPTE